MRCVSNEGHWRQWDKVERATPQESSAYPSIAKCCVTLSKSLLLSRAQDSHL